MNRLLATLTAPLIVIVGTTASLAESVSDRMAPAAAYAAAALIYTPITERVGVLSDQIIDEVEQTRHINITPIQEQTIRAVVEVLATERVEKLFSKQVDNMAETLTTAEIAALQGFLLDNGGSDPVLGTLLATPDLTAAQTAALNRFFQTSHGQSIKEKLPDLITSGNDLAKQMKKEITPAVNAEIAAAIN